MAITGVLNARVSDFFVNIKAHWNKAPTEKKVAALAGAAIAALALGYLYTSPLGIAAKIGLSLVTTAVAAGLFVRSYITSVNLSKTAETSVPSKPTSIIPLHQKDSLTVGKIDREEYGKYLASSKEIFIIAGRKRRQARGGPDESIFSSSSGLWQSIVQCLEIPDEKKVLYFCKDTKENIQGALAVQIKDKEIYIDILLTHPKNIESSLNKESERIRGVGSILLKTAEELALTLGKQQVSLISSPSAHTFYKKMGYATSTKEGADPDYMFKSMEKTHSFRSCINCFFWNTAA